MLNRKLFCKLFNTIFLVIIEMSCLMIGPSSYVLQLFYGIQEWIEISWEAEPWEQHI